MTEHAEHPTLKVFYDGSCPICRRETGLYEGMDTQQNMAWIDISRPEENRLPASLSRYDAMARFHVCDEHGRVSSGARAFVEIWLRLPRLRWLGRFARLPGCTWALEQCYRLFLVLRPVLARWRRVA